MIKEWLGKEVLLEDLTRHDKWLCMMMPRLKLLRELLHDDGVIFVTLDDIEVHRCKLLMDEIFGEINFVTNIPWQARKSVQNDTDISNSHNHILVYAKNRRQEERRLKKSNSKRWHRMPGFVFQPMELANDQYCIAYPNASVYVIVSLERSRVDRRLAANPMARALKLMLTSSGA